MTDRVSTNPLAALAEPTGDYEFTARIEFHVSPWPLNAASGRDVLPVASGYFVLSGGRFDGRWTLTVNEVLGEEPDGDDGDVADVLGPTLLDLRDQALGIHPQALLRALLSGGTE